MITINLICLLLAFICFVLSAFGVSAPRFNLLPAGLAFWVLGVLLAGR